MSCLFIIAAFCFSDPMAAKADIDPPSSVGRFAAIDVGNARVEILLGSDAFAEYDARQFARACSGKSCVDYYKRCGPADDGFSCSYNFGDTPYAQPALVIRGPNRAAIEIVERNIAMFPGAARTNAVSLSLLTVLAGPGTTPWCRRDGNRRAPQCPPKRR